MLTDVCCVEQLSFYGFGPSSSCILSPASDKVQLKNWTSDESEDRDESSQDSGVGTDFTAPAQCNCKPAVVLSDRTNLMDVFLLTGKLGSNQRKPVFSRSFSLPPSVVS